MIQLDTPNCPYAVGSTEAIAWWKGRLQGLREASNMIRPSSKQHALLIREIARSERERLLDL